MTNNGCIPVKNTLDCSTVVFYECPIIHFSPPVVFCTVRAVHKFDCRLVINEATKNWWLVFVTKNYVMQWYSCFFTGSVCFPTHTPNFSHECQGNLRTPCKAITFSWVRGSRRSKILNNWLVCGYRDAPHYMHCDWSAVLWSMWVRIITTSCTLHRGSAAVVLQNCVVMDMGAYNYHDLYTSSWLSCRYTYCRRYLLYANNGD